MLTVLSKAISFVPSRRDRSGVATDILGPALLSVPRIRAVIVAVVKNAIDSTYTLAEVKAACRQSTRSRRPGIWSF